MTSKDAPKSPQAKAAKVEQESPARNGPSTVLQFTTEPGTVPPKITARQTMDVRMQGIVTEGYRIAGIFNGYITPRGPPEAIGLRLVTSVGYGQPAILPASLPDTRANGCSVVSEYCSFETDGPPQWWSRPMTSCGGAPFGSLARRNAFCLRFWSACVLGRRP